MSAGTASRVEKAREEGERVLSALERLVEEVRHKVMVSPREIQGMAQRGDLSRLLHAAVGTEYRRRVNYDPEADARVEFVREVIRTGRCGEVKVDASLSATVEFLMEEGGV